MYSLLLNCYNSLIILTEVLLKKYTFKRKLLKYSYIIHRLKSDYRNYWVIFVIGSIYFMANFYECMYDTQDHLRNGIHSWSRELRENTENAEAGS